MQKVIDKLAGELDITKKAAKEVVGTVIAGIVEELLETGKVKVADLGTFSTIERAARKARNPKTGEPVAVAAKTVVKFKVANSLATEVKIK